MSESARPNKRRGWLFKLGIVLGVLVVLLVITYFVVTSSAFLTGVILPRVSKSANADVTVTSASLSPWSEVVLSGLKVTPHGKETLVQASEVRARYSLRDIIGGKIVVNEVTLADPVITLVQNADGTGNLDPLTQQQKPAEQKPAPPTEEKKKPSTPPQVNINNITLKNARVEITKNVKGGGRQVTQVSGFNLNIDHIQNGQPGKLTVVGNIAYENTPSAQTNQPVTTDSLQAKLDGSFNYKFANDLMPDSVTGSTRVDVVKTGGSMTNLAGLATILDTDLTASEIKKVSVRFEQSGTQLGELRVSGPFAMATTEGHLKAELISIDRRVLNIVGGPLGMDFNKTAINSSNDIDLKQKGTVIAVNGQFNIVDFSLTQAAKKLTTPVLNLQASYQVNVDQNQKSALVQKLNLDGTQNQTPFLHGQLSKPLPVTWGTAGSGMPEEAALDLVVTNFDLAAWQSFAADLAPAGNLNANLHVLSRQAGKQLAIDLTSALNNFSARVGSNQIAGADITLSASTQVDDFKKVKIGSYGLNLAQNNQPAVTVSGNGTVDTESKDADLTATVGVAMPQLFSIVKVPDTTATSGGLRVDSHIVQTKGAQNVTATVALTNLSGTFAKSTLDRFETRFDTDLSVKNDQLQINKMTGAFQQAGQPAGTLNVTGTYNMVSKAGQFGLKVVDLNQNLLKPFVASALPGKQLASISINANASATMETNGAQNIQGDFGITNLVVRATNQVTAPAPLSAQFKLDVGMAQQKIDLRQVQIALSPTARAKNQVDIKGQVDMSQTNAMKASLGIVAESIDVTPFYDIVAGAPKSTEKPAQPAPTTTTPAPAPAPSGGEPEPMSLPIQQANVTLNIGKFYLRQIEITNWQGGIKIEGSHVVVNPFQLAVNGAPINMNADLDLGVKGYKYQLSLLVDKVPVQPLADSFMTNTPGAYKGLLLANASIKGAGVTGTSMRSNLQGTTTFSLTNATVQITGKWLPGLLQPIATILKLPDITTDPLTSMSGNVAMGEGKINVQTFNFRSAAFVADVHGEIQIADVLTNSPISLPMTFALQRELVKKVPFFASLATTNSDYIELPEFVKVGGTLGNPSAKPNLTLKNTASSILKGIGGQVGGGNTKNVLQGIGGILGGQTAPQTNAPAGTNAPATNALPGAVNQLLDIFGRPKK